MNHPPVPFGRYRLVSLLGEGGMAKVYRAVLSGPMGFEKEVALKRIDPKLTSDERVVKALINEARLGGQLRHKNIVEIYEFNQVDGNYYMAMEFVDGWTLDGVLRRLRSRGGAIPPTVVVEIMAHVCRGLEYAHSIKDKSGQPMNLVHRDLKPGNIILSRQGDVKIMDFGIAKSDGNLYKTTAADVTKGTPIYMSPEQVTGAPLDARSDIFSLGSVLHELLTNEVPFQGDNLLAIMHGVLNADITAARQRVAAVAPECESLLVRCMARNPADRFATVSEFERALRDLRKTMAGTTLLDWVEEVQGAMPQPVRAGEFGPDGAPMPLAYGTQSLAQVGAVSPEQPWQWAPDAQSQRAATIDADTLEVGTLGERTGGAPRPAPMGKVTQDFFRTEGAVPQAPPAPGAQIAPGAGGPVDGSKTRVHRTTELQAPSTTAERKALKKSKQGGLPGWVVGALAAVVLLSAALAALLMGGKTDAPVVRTDGAPPAPGATATPAPISPTPAPPAPVATAPTTPAPTPASTVATPSAPSSEPVRDAPPKGTDSAGKEPGGKEPKSKDPKVAGTGNDTKLSPKTGLKGLNPVSAVGAGTTAGGTGSASSSNDSVAGTAKLLANSIPWSFVYLDGRSLGATPIKGLEIGAGSHELRFHCTQECEPAAEKTYTFEVAPGATHKQIHYFKSGTP